MEKNYFEFCNEFSFSQPLYVSDSAWLEHGPFALWLISKLKPKIVVELGTHTGYSYFCFCQAVNNSTTSTKLFAVDNWEGDQHTGLYSADIFETVRAVNDQCYSNFSTLLKTDFKEASNYFSDASVDLLHIDGYHTYDAVLNDFYNWESKLSNQSIVLFHDINVRKNNFGVFKFWDEIKLKYPYFEFIHGHGLGVLKYGEGRTDLDVLFEINSDEKIVREIQNLYSVLGSNVSSKFNLVKLQRELNSMTKDRDAWIERNKIEVTALQNIINDLRSTG